MVTAAPYVSKENLQVLVFIIEKYLTISVFWGVDIYTENLTTQNYLAISYLLL